ncbi:uncharacterized protein K460DRAFT_397718 [Cucurbitaria berberidis CBS 394.84]|uniref:Epidermal growth factor receptor-like transmembrane-juxtamembrane segment domain-containing protein n=1 Tax=Cucurbitaria berberidis CBS 394.84 TaxID=1168544 RepID=A0A9P4G9I2_9PLEO|nr:uncharacterized protein K460DRAFT_397718 [Cucurbitaria berberidis CBS 394.84]KAF1841500.1 hypothetical protein K460DRAFT_397718 [Cucurbitaria berberidis CBS 394.84]
MSNSSFFDFHCPTGGKWYACATGSKFVGCCTTDPCGANGCVQGNIRAGGYNVSHHGEWPDASCGSASDFFTCNAASTFWGCCKVTGDTNPCNSTPPATCPQGNLVPAFLERPEQFQAYTSATSSSSATPTSKKSNTGAIAGGVVGGVVALAIIGLIIFFILRKKRRAQNESATAMLPMTSEKPDGARGSTQYGGQSPPPTYTAPNQEYYQDASPNKGPYQQRYANMMDGPQELPGEVPASNEHRYSELPAESSSSAGNRRFSELPAGATRVSELESPETSPRPLQSEFSTDLAKRVNQEQGLGLTTEETPKRN